MKINERLASIVKSKELTRREFAQKLIDLSPKVSRVGEIPTVSTIYGYLNGRINIPVDLISFMAEALDISEQEFFDTSKNAKRKFFNYLIVNATKNELEHYKNVLSSKLLLDLKSIDDNDFSFFESQNQSKIEEILKYIKYAPTPFLDKILHTLKRYKNLTQEL